MGRRKAGPATSRPRPGSLHHNPALCFASIYDASRAQEGVMRTRERGRRLPDIDVLARSSLRRGLGQHPDAAKHVADIGDIEKMSTWELMNLASAMGVDPGAMIRSLEQEDDKRWEYSSRYPGFQGEVEFDLVIELLGKKVTRRAKVVYTHTPEWEYFDERKQAPYTGWGGTSYHLEILAVPEQDDDGDSVTIFDKPSWTTLEDLNRDDVVPLERWDAILDLVDDKCKEEDAERRRVAAAKATSPSRPSRRRH